MPEAATAATSSWSFGLSLGILLAISHGSLPWLVVGALSYPAKRHSQTIQILVPVAAVFAVETFVSSSGLFVPWVLLGHSQSPNSVGWASLATFGGVPVISAAIVALAVSVPLYFGESKSTRGSRHALLILTVILCYPAIYSLAITIEEEPQVNAQNNLTILAIQPNFPRSDRWISGRQSVFLDRIGQYTEYAIHESVAAPDLVLWPENLVTPGVGWSDLSPGIVGWAERLQSPLVSGVAIPYGAQNARLYRNVVQFATPGSESTTTIDKQISIPFLESDQFLGLRFDRLTQWLGPRFSNSPRAATQHVPTTADGTNAIAPFLCFEALFPREVANRRFAQTRFLATLADDSWIPDKSATDQLTRYSAFRAIEQGVPHIRVAHGGRTLVHDARGQIVDQLPLDQWGSLLVEIPPPQAERSRSFAAVALSVLFGVFAASMTFRPGRPVRRR